MEGIGAKWGVIMSFVWHISMQNMRRWKFRLLSISVLLAITLTLYTLYSSYLASVQSSGRVALNDLNLPYDVLVQVPPGDRLLTSTELPRLPQGVVNRAVNPVQLVEVMELTVRVEVQSAKGSFFLQGIDAHSSIYHPTRLQLQGEWLAHPGDIILPLKVFLEADMRLGDSITLSTWSNHPWQKAVHSQSFVVVGTYNAYSQQPALVLVEDALPLTINDEPNCALFIYRRTTTQADGIVTTIDSFLRWLTPAYPNATYIEARTPTQMGRSLLGRIYRPGQGLLFLIILFVFIGTLTIAVMTYLERRREFAAMKTLGLSQQQMIAMFVVEYGLTQLLGIVMGVTILLLVYPRVPWMADLGAAVIPRITIFAVLWNLAAVLFAVTYPVATAVVATVNQLLFARRIPFVTRHVHYMQDPRAHLVYREREENLRFLKTLPPSEASGSSAMLSGVILLLKQVGDKVKQGEAVAVMEQSFGLIVQEWNAPCDGTIEEMKPDGIIAIRPDLPDAPFYPYPVALLEMEQKVRRSHREAATAYADFRQKLGDVSDVYARSMEREWRLERAAQRSVAAAKGEDFLPDSDTGTVVDYAAIARQEQRARQQEIRQQSTSQLAGLMRRLRPVAVAAAVALSYYGLTQWAAYQGSLVDTQAAIYRVAETGVLQRWAAPSLNRGYNFTWVEFTNLQQLITADSNLAPRSASQLVNAVAGSIAAVPVADGAAVEQGELLLVLENPSAELALEQARQELVNARLAYDTLRLQAGSGASSEDALAIIRQQGSVAALSNSVEELKIYANTPGVITEVLPVLGDNIAVGTRLFAFYNPARESGNEREIRLLQAKSRLAAAERALAQLEVRGEQGGVVTHLAVSPGREVAAGDDLLTLELDPQSLDAAATLQLQRMALELEQYWERVRQLAITAPISGTLTGFSLRVGDRVSLSSRLGEVSSQGSYTFAIQVPQNQINHINLGKTAEIQLLHNASSYQGVVSEIATTGQPSGVQVNYRVLLQVSTTQELPLGVRAAVTFPATAAHPELGPFGAGGQASSVEAVLAEAAGEISAIYVQNGDYVAEGTILALIANPELELSLANAQESYAKLLRREYKAPQGATVEFVLSPGMRVEAGDLLYRLYHEGIQLEYAKALKELADLEAMLVGNDYINSRSSGSLANLYVSVGEWVEADTLVAELHNPNLAYEAARAASDLAKLEASYLASQSNPLGGALEAARLRLQLAEENFSRREQAVAALEVRAPHAGVAVWQRPLRVGESLAANQSLFKLSNFDELAITFAVSESEIAYISPGMDVYLYVWAFEEDYFYGKVTYVSPVGQVSGGNVSFPVSVAVEADPRLKAGMTTTLQILLWEVPGVLVVPRQYLFSDMVDGKAVEFVNRLVSGRLVPRQVQTGARSNNMVEITSGLREGDMIFISR